VSEPPPSLPPPVAPASAAERLAAAATALGVDPSRLRRWAVIGGACFAVAVALWLFLGGRSQPAEITLPRAGGPGDPGAGATTATSALGTAEGPATAHAAGAVARPGVYRLPPAARVTDLIDAAGGAAADADLDQLNLAATVADGERIYVPRRGEAPVAPGGGATGAATPSGPVDLNRATAEQLDALPGVGPSTAQAILDHRTRTGRFRSVDDLLEVRGIGPAKLEQLRPLVKV
jgi:competence protein ComEA